MDLADRRGREVKEVTAVRDPSTGAGVEVSSKLTDRLRGKYAVGPTGADGEPEFGWRQFPTPPIQHEAADEIDRLRAAVPPPLQWRRFDHEDAATWPPEPGLYCVMVEGDSEYCDGHLIYAFGDYTTFAVLHPADENGGRRFSGEHDEEPYNYKAWCGPVVIPPYDLER